MRNFPLTRRALQIAAIAALLPLTAMAQETVKLKLSSFESPLGGITSRVLTPMAKAMTESSKGALQVDVFAGGTLGRNPAQQLKLVTDGVADIAWVVLPYTPGRFDDTDVVALPFIANNALEAGLALQRMYAAGELNGFAGLKMLALGATPPVVVHSNVPVRTPADIKNRRVRVSGDHLTKVVEALGGAPVQQAGGQIAEAMSRGVVDMTLNNWGFVGDFKVNEVSSHHLDLPLGAVAVGIVMRQDRYDKLPKAARDAIDRHSGEVLARKVGDVFDQLEREVLERVSKSPRNTVVRASEAETAQWKAAIEPTNTAWRQAKPRNEVLHKSFNQHLSRIRDGK